MDQHRTGPQCVRANLSACTSVPHACAQGSKHWCKNASTSWNARHQMSAKVRDLMHRSMAQGGRKVFSSSHRVVEKSFRELSAPPSIARDDPFFDIPINFDVIGDIRISLYHHTPTMELVRMPRGSTARFSLLAHVLLHVLVLSRWCRMWRLSSKVSVTDYVLHVVPHGLHYGRGDVVCKERHRHGLVRQQARLVLLTPSQHQRFAIHAQRMLYCIARGLTRLEHEQVQSLRQELPHDLLLRASATASR